MEVKTKDLVLVNPRRRLSDILQDSTEGIPRVTGHEEKTYFWELLY